MSETTQNHRAKISERFAGDKYTEARQYSNIMAISGPVFGLLGIVLTWFLPLLGFVLGVAALICAAEGMIFSKYRVMGALGLVAGMTCVFVSVGPMVFSWL